MRVCVISNKECWREPETGRWVSYGGFPAQMSGIAALFEEMDLLIVEGRVRPGGVALPEKARVVAMPSPAGADGARKLSVLRHLPSYVSLMARHIRAADVVHTPLPGDLPLVGLYTAAALGKRLVARYGGSWAANNETTFMNRVTRGSMRLLARLGRRRHVMLATGLGAEAPAPGMDWIFSTALSAAELAGIQPDLARPLASPARLVYAGRLSSEKGVHVLIEAAALLKERGFEPAPRITILGGGGERAALEAQARARNVDGWIEFAGQVDRAELSRRFLEADLCVQPSLTEGFSKAWLDAMAHGVPVLASKVGAAADVIGQDRGWVIEPGNARLLADTLAEVLGSAETARAWPALRARCRAHVETLTLESWSRRIGELCAARWQCGRESGGRLTLAAAPGKSR